MMFCFAPSSPMMKTLLVFWVTATKCHLYVYSCCHFRAVLLFLMLNREFFLHTLPFIFQPLCKTENSLLLSREDSWQIQCKGITSPRLVEEANGNQPHHNLSSCQHNAPVCFLLPLKRTSTTSHILWETTLWRSLWGCWWAPWFAAGTSLLPRAPLSAAPLQMWWLVAATPRTSLQPCTGKGKIHRELLCLTCLGQRKAKIGLAPVKSRQHDPSRSGWGEGQSFVLPQLLRDKAAARTSSLHPSTLLLGLSAFCIHGVHISPPFHEKGLKRKNKSNSFVIQCNTNQLWQDLENIFTVPIT